MAQQNKLFDEFYEAGLKNSPERATSYGDYRYNALLAQYSLAEIARQHAEADEFLQTAESDPDRRDERQGRAEPSIAWSGRSSGRTSTTI